MTKFEDSQIQAIKSQLDVWFANQLPRGSCVHINDLIVDVPSATLAARLYKRNGIEIIGTSQAVASASATSVSEDNRPPAVPHDTKISSCLTWQEFFKTNRFQNAELVIDDTVYHLLPRDIELNKIFFAVHRLNCTETEKNLDTLFRLANAVKENTTTLLAIGGGIASDITGCVAGLLQKQLAIVPTTWLAAIDASVGGKNGVNHAQYGKNQIGLFLEPQNIFIIDEVFRLQSRGLFLCGFAEALKHRWLAGNNNLAAHADLKRLSDKNNLSDPKNENDSTAFVLNHIAFKKSVVQRDPLEHDLRRILNFGHTYAHVIETLGDLGYIKKLPHGVAVAIGMKIIRENYISKLGTHEADGSTSEQDYKDFTATLDALLAEMKTKFSFDLPIQILKPIDRAVVEQLLMADKKRTNSEIVLVTPPFGLLKSEMISEAGYVTKTSVTEATNIFLNYLYSSPN